MELPLTLFPNNKITYILFDEVTNCGELLAGLKSKSLPDMTLLNAEWVISAFQLQAAATKALENKKYETMRTADVHIELVYILAANRNVGESLRKFGINDKVTRVCVVLFDATEDKLQQVRALIKGREVSPDLIGSFVNTDNVISYYKIQKKELQVGSLEDAVLTRIATAFL